MRPPGVRMPAVGGVPNLRYQVLERPSALIMRPIDAIQSLRSRSWDALGPLLEATHLCAKAYRLGEVRPPVPKFT
jgi:hypothetical protein